MKILIYYQGNKRTVFLESLAKELESLGHDVLFLTMEIEGVLHDYLRNYRIDAYAMPTHLNSKFKQIKFLYHFCKKNKVEVILPHLQMANFQALIISKISNIRSFPCRHHINGSFLIKSRKAQILDRLVNLLAVKQVVVSNHAKRFMVEQENAQASKIVPIPLGYDFSLYHKPNDTKVTQIKEKLPFRLRLIMISRMIKSKRHLVVFKALNRLIKEGLSIGMIVLDRGAEYENLQAFIHANDLEKNILLVGYQNNIIDYVDASDLLVLPSILESSNQVVKEVAIRGKTAIVCQGIGDFDEYIVDKDNAFFISQPNAEEDIYTVLRDIYNNLNVLDNMGRKLKAEVLERFDIKQVTKKYLKLISEN